MARRFCPDCNSALSIRNLELGRCESCGAKISDDIGDSEFEDRKSERVQKKRTRPLRDADEESDEDNYETLLKQSKKQSSTLLFIVAALTMVCGGLAVFVLGDQPGADPIETVVGIALIACIAAIFAALGFWAMYMPFPPTLIGLILFTGITALDLIADPAMAVKGLIFRIVIFVSMIRALNTAVNVSKLSAKHGARRRDYDDELPSER